jgi:hypothetical protein
MFKQQPTQTIWQGDNQPHSIILLCVCVCECVIVCVYVSLSLWLQLVQESVDETFWSNAERVQILDGIWRCSENPILRWPNSVV